MSFRSAPDYLSDFELTGVEGQTINLFPRSARADGPGVLEYLLDTSPISLSALHNTQDLLVADDHDTLPKSTWTDPTFIPLTFPLPLATNKTPRKSSTKSSLPTQPPRPPNAWLLYRNDRLALLSTADSKRPQHELSKAIAAAWRAEHDHIRRTYEMAAQQKKEAHYEQYPEYKYKRSGRRAISSEGFSADAIGPLQHANALARSNTDSPHPGSAKISITQSSSKSARTRARSRTDASVERLLQPLSHELSATSVISDPTSATLLQDDGARSWLHSSAQTADHTDAPSAGQQGSPGDTLPPAVVNLEQAHEQHLTSQTLPCFSTPFLNSFVDRDDVGLKRPTSSHDQSFATVNTSVEPHVVRFDASSPFSASPNIAKASSKRKVSADPKSSSEVLAGTLPEASKEAFASFWSNMPHPPTAVTSSGHSSVPVPDNRSNPTTPSSIRSAQSALSMSFEFHSGLQVAHTNHSSLESPSSSSHDFSSAGLSEGEQHRPRWWPFRHVRVRQDDESGVELQHFIAHLQRHAARQ